MAKKPEEFSDPSELSDFYVKTAEFPAGFMTQYQPSMIVGDDTYQSLAKGCPIGKRFKSERVIRIGDRVPAHLGHHAKADGRWRIYAFADTTHQALNKWAEWLLNDKNSPLNRFTPQNKDIDGVFDIKVVYPQMANQVEITDIPKVFLPSVGPFGLTDYEKIYALNKEVNIFESREIDSSGAVIVVRPDQYVAHILPFAETDKLTEFFAQNMCDR